MEGSVLGGYCGAGGRLMLVCQLCRDQLAENLQPSSYWWLNLRWQASEKMIKVVSCSRSLSEVKEWRSFPAREGRGLLSCLLRKRWRDLVLKASPSSSTQLRLLADRRC